MTETKLIALQVPDDDDRPAYRAVRHVDNRVIEVPASQSAYTVEANGWSVRFEFNGVVGMAVDEKGPFYHFAPRGWRPLD